MSEAVAVVPAAGASRRMGRDKLLLPWGDTVVIGALLRALSAGGVQRRVVVVPPDNPELERWLAEAGERSVVNPAPARGMLSSIGEGLDALGGPEALATAGTTLVVCPADHPAVDGETVAALIACIEAGAGLALPTHRGRRGHPLAISAGLIGDIPRLDPEIGLRQLVDCHRESLVEMPVEHAGVVDDLDTPADYEAARRNA